MLIKACSAFTRVALCVLGEPPNGGPFHRGSSVPAVTLIDRSISYPLFCIVQRNGRYVELGREALAAQDVWPILLHISPARVQDAVHVVQDWPDATQQSAAALGVSRIVSPPVPARSPGVRRIAIGTLSDFRGGPGAAASAAHHCSRSCCQSGPDGIYPSDRGKRMEHCPQARKSAPMRIHG